MAKEHIGHLPCPACGEDAPIREAKTGRAYITCTSPVCGFQGFARSADADKALRAKMRPIAAAIAALPVPTKAAPASQPEPKKKGFFDDLYIS